MKIALLSQNKTLYSIRRLRQEAKALGFEGCDVLNPLRCQLVLHGSQSRIQYLGKNLPSYDAILPRIGSSITEYGLSVVQHFELLQTLCINGSQGIWESRNKLRSLQRLQGAGIGVPHTVLSRTTEDLYAAVEAVRGLPVILKTLQGTQGIGVMLIHTPASLESVLSTLQKLNQNAFIQQFLTQDPGQDYRILVVGQQAVAAMKRSAPQGDFRSNIHRGGSGTPVRLSPAYARLAVLATRTLHLEVAGVDLIRGPKGPLVLEVNSSPGFEGLEKATGINVAQAIMKHIQKRIKQR